MGVRSGVGVTDGGAGTRAGSRSGGGVGVGGLGGTGNGLAVGAAVGTAGDVVTTPVGSGAGVVAGCAACFGAAARIGGRDVAVPPYGRPGVVTAGRERSTAGPTGTTATAGGCTAATTLDGPGEGSVTESGTGVDVGTATCAT